MGVKQVKAVINGVTTVLTLNSSTGKYEATITARQNPVISRQDIIIRCL